jgi:hypothetical protein
VLEFLFQQFEYKVSYVVENEWDYDFKERLSRHISAHTNKKYECDAYMTSSYYHTPNNKFLTQEVIVLIYHQKLSPRIACLLIPNGRRVVFELNAISQTRYLLTQILCILEVFKGHIWKERLI